MWSNLAYMKAKGGSGGGEECSSGQGEAHTLEAKDTDSCSRSTGELCYIKKKTLSLFLSTGSITDDVIISCDVFRRTELDAKAPL